MLVTVICVLSTVRDKQPVEREIADQHCRVRGTVHWTCKFPSFYLWCQFPLLGKSITCKFIVSLLRIIQSSNAFSSQRASSQQLGVWRVKFPSGFAGRSKVIVM